jgi:hypothetical protein
MLLISQSPRIAAGKSSHQPLILKAGDVIPAGNEWISLLDLRADNGAFGDNS